MSSLLIYELGKGALGMIEPRYELGTEHAGMYGNLDSANHPVPSH